MIIGIDIDDVIAEFSKAYVPCAIYLNSKNHKTGFKDKKLFPTKGMFFWSKNECQNSNKYCVSTIFDFIKPKSDARSCLARLKENGHKIVLISARGKDRYSTRKQTINWLRNNGICYDKLFTHISDKAEIAKKEKIDIMIEDQYHLANQMQNAGIKTILFKSYFNGNEKTKCKIFNSWIDVYEYINPGNPIKDLPIIIDTDVCNEVDDEFALAYLLKSNLNLKAITIAPNFFLTSANLDIEKNCLNSYKKAVQICNLTNKSFKDKVFMGSTNFCTVGFDTTSPAVEKIIETARQNDKTLIVAIGAPTNISLALKKAPDIKNKIKILFLGGDFFTMDNNEYNYAQDYVATNHLFSAGLDLTVFPVQNVTEKLILSLPYLVEKLEKNECNKILIKDFEKTIKKLKVSIKPLFDVCPIAYILNQNLFDVQKKSYGILNTRLDFKKSKYSANFVVDFKTNAVLDSLTRTLNKRNKNEN